MDIITSLENNTIKLFAKLKEKKYRDEYGAYLIEGYRSVKDSVAYAVNPRLLFSQSAYEKFCNEFNDYESIVCSDAVFAKVGDTVSTQGVVCMADIPQKETSFSCKNALFLDRVRDPGNLGTIIRSALATGFNDIYCYNCVDAYNSKVVRSAMSAVSRVNIYNVNDDTLTLLRTNGYKLVCADMDGVDVFSTNLDCEKVCLIIGNEANGVEERLIKQADFTVSLPMAAGESLNAAVSAAVLMYMFSFGKNK